MIRLASLTLAAGMMFSHIAVSACVYPPPSPPAVDETDIEYAERSRSELEAYLLEAARRTEAAYFAEAKSIYLARIVKSEEITVDGSHFARQVRVTPLEAIRGSLPTSQIELKDRELTSCGLDGDGPVTWGAVSHITIVFDGVRNEGMDFRSSRYAILASKAQQPQLVAAWNRWKANAAVLFDH